MFLAKPMLKIRPGACLPFNLVNLKLREQSIRSAPFVLFIIQYYDKHERGKRNGAMRAVTEPHVSALVLS